MNDLLLGISHWYSDGNAGNQIGEVAINKQKLPTVKVVEFVCPRFRFGKLANWLIRADMA